MNKTTQQKKEIAAKQNKLITLMLTKAGLKKQDIYDVAIRRWVNGNLDLLSAAERAEFRDVLSL